MCQAIILRNPLTLSRARAESPCYAKSFSSHANIIIEVLVVEVVDVEVAAAAAVGGGGVRGVVDAVVDVEAAGAFCIEFHLY
jgi:hypothetical protein